MSDLLRTPSKKSIISDEKPFSRIFVVLAMLFAMCIITSNILAAKLIQVGPWVMPSGVLIFPIVYILGDTLTEVYGYAKMKIIIWTGFAVNAVAVGFFQLAIAIPSPIWFEDSEAFSIILGATPRILVASLVAYLVGSFANAKCMKYMRTMWKKQLFARCSISTVIGQFLDSAIFITVAFAFSMEWSQVGIMIITQSVFKILYEIVIYPLTRLSIVKFRSWDDTAQD